MKIEILKTFEIVRITLNIYFYAELRFAVADTKVSHRFMVC